MESNVQFTADSHGAIIGLSGAGVFRKNKGRVEAFFEEIINGYEKEICIYSAIQAALKAFLRARLN